MIRRDMDNEAGARSDGLMIVSVIFIAAFTYIALTTNPVYTGVGVGDKVPEWSLPEVCSRFCSSTKQVA